VPGNRHGQGGSFIGACPGSQVPEPGTQGQESLGEAGQQRLRGPASDQERDDISAHRPRKRGMQTDERAGIKGLSISLQPFVRCPPAGSQGAPARRVLAARNFYSLAPAPSWAFCRRNSKERHIFPHLRE
jgi:hypothetical protein